MFSCEFCEVFKNAFFTEHLRWLLLCAVMKVNQGNSLKRAIVRGVLTTLSNIQHCTNVTSNTHRWRNLSWKTSFFVQCKIKGFFKYDPGFSQDISIDKAKVFCQFGIGSHYVKNVRMQRLSGQYFPAFGLKTDQKNSKYRHFLCGGYCAWMYRKVWESCLNIE